MIKNEQKIEDRYFIGRFNYDIMKDDVFIRTRRPGDYLVLDAAGHRQKLKAFFINRKIEKAHRESILLVCKGSRVLWVTGHRIDALYGREEPAQRIAEIKIKSQ